MGANTTQSIIQLITQSEISEPQISGNIAVTGILDGDAPRHGDVLSMDIAMEMGSLNIGETGEVPRLKFSSDQPTLIRVGEAVLEGGKQDRIVRKSEVIDGTRNVDVFCIEAGRWSPQNTHWAKTDTPVSLRKMVMRGADQGQVWAKVDKILSEWDVSSSTRALGAMYTELGNRFQRRASKLTFQSDQVGMIVTVDNNVLGMEYFGDLMGFSRDAPKILMNSYIPEAKEEVREQMDRKSVIESINVFVAELQNGSRNCDILRRDSEILYACAV